MRTYTITDPSGKTHTIDGPEGATREQVIAKIQERLQSSNVDTNPKVDPYTATAQKQSVVDNLLAGAGGGMYGMYLGAKQLLGKATPEEINEHKQAMAGLRSTTAGTIGDIGGQVAAAIPAAFIPGANTYAGAALTGAGIGALQPTAENESRGQNMALGAAGGAAGKFIGDKAIGLLRGRNTPQTTIQTNVSGQGNASVSGGGSSFGSVGDDASAGLNVPTKNVLERAQKMGFKVTPGQASGSKSLQQMEAKLESQPMTSGTFNAIKEHNQQTLNKAAAGAIGERSNTLDSAVLSNAKDRISGVYKMVADDRARPIPADDFLTRVSALEDEFEGLLPQSLSDNVLVKRLFSFAESGQATGKQLQDIASKLGKVAANHMTTPSGDRQMGMVLNRVKDIADDYLESGLSGQTAKTFKEARQQYRNLMLLTQRQGVVNPASGDVNGGALASILQQKDKNGYLFGKNQTPLYDAARFSQAFKPLVGNSGTATRSMITSPMDALLTLPFNVATKAYTSKPVVNAAAGIGNGLSPELAALLSNRYGLSQLSGGAIGANLNNR